MYAEATCTSCTATIGETIAYGEIYFIDLCEEELPDIIIKHIQPAKDKSKPRKLFTVNRYNRRFQGFNHGRHWDRKRRN
jgi:hypothetical protein